MYLPTAEYDEAVTMVANARKAMSDKDKDAIAKYEIDLESLLNKLTGKIFFGIKKEAIEPTLENIDRRIVEIENLFSRISRVSKATDAAKNRRYLLIAKYDELQLSFADIKEKYKNYQTRSETIANTTDEAEKAILQTALEKDIRTTIENALTLIENINFEAKWGGAESSGDSYVVNLETLNLNGAVIRFFSHVSTEEDAFNPQNTSITNREKYAEYLKELERKYNFKLSFEGYPGGDYDKLTENLSTHLRGNPNEAAIVRVAETKVMIDNILARNFYPMQSVIDTFRTAMEKEGKEAFISEWQVEKAKVFGKSFGIQRFDGVTYPEMFLFNRDILKQANITDAEMPDQLWVDGNWTLEAMNNLVVKIKAQNQNVIPLGLSPYYLGINAVNANGIELVSSDETKTIRERLNLNKGEVTSILAEYTKLYQDGAAWYYSGDAGASSDVEAGRVMKANHMRDGFAAGKIAMAAMQNWQVYIDDLENYGVVPFPQIGTQDNSKYISPIEAGDALCVTRGKNHNEVATILLLINQYFINERKLEIENERTDLGLPANATKEQVLTEVFVNDKIIAPKAYKELSKQVVSFVHGYSEHKNTVPSILAQIGADLTYSLALQKACKDNFGFAKYLGEAITKIEKDYKELYDIVKAY